MSVIDDILYYADPIVSFLDTYKWYILIIAGVLLIFIIKKVFF